MLYQVVHHEPPAPAEANPALAGAISDVIVRGLSKESADRFADVLEFAAALRAAVDATTSAQPSGAPEVALPVEAVTPEGAMDAEVFVADLPGGRPSDSSVASSARTPLPGGSSRSPSRRVSRPSPGFTRRRARRRAPPGTQLSGQVHKVIDRVR